MRLRHTLLAVLVFALLTVSVRELWARSALEFLVYAMTAAMLLRVIVRRQPLRVGMVMAPLVFLCLWSVAQLAFHWSVVKAATGEALLYWLAAACLVLLGYNACSERRQRELFLQSALIAGSIVGLVGIVQMFTSPGRILWLFPSGYESLVIGPFVYWNNYAVFVELLVPIALVLAFRTNNTWAYLLVAAALAASVVAAGSRAGTLLVVLEIALVFLLRSRQGVDNGYRCGRAFLIFAVLVSAFTLIVGYRFLWERFSADRDPYSIRREFLLSSISMVRAHPLHGFGFGTWTSVYPQFATIDTGLFANHAHNEWAQWAAEGGLPALLMLVSVLLWSLSPALRSLWGLGIVSVLVHAWVDYPFLRLGLAAWIFALLGALAAYDAERRGKTAAPGAHSWSSGFRSRVVAGAAIPVLVLGMFQACRLAWADTLYRRATPDDISRAARLYPDNAQYVFTLAQVEPDLAMGRLQRALSLNPYLTRVRTALAAELERRGEVQQSEAMLLEAARRDKRYAPAWELANFYFRQERPRPFWFWARKAAEISYGDLAPLFDLCFHLTPDGQTVLRRVVVGRRNVEKEYLAYLIARKRLPDAHTAALRVASQPLSGDRELLLHYIEQSLAAGRAANAFEIWNRLCAHRLLPYPAAGPGSIVNGDFAQPILDRAFDWRLPYTAGVDATRLESRALQVAFSGNQPEQFEILNHFLLLSPGTAYVLRFQYRTLDLPRQTGLFWSFTGQEQTPLAATGRWAQAEWRFRAPAGTARLALDYRRCPGTTRAAGKLLLRNIELREGL